ncbi:MAG: phosphotransferase [Actinomycetota bacterium]
MSDANALLDDVVSSIEEWREQDVRISPLSGGLTNSNYRVDVQGRSYVVRIPGRSTELLSIDRANERHNTEAAAETGVGAGVAYYVEKLGVIVLEFIDGATMSPERLRTPDMARRMGESLRRLHSARRFLKDFDMFRLVEFYRSVVRERGIRIPDGYERALPVVERIEAALQRSPLPSAPCNNDLLAENYIDDGEALRIVDYEYSGNNEPSFELGNTALECGFGPDLRAVLCEAYFGDASKARLARMDVHALMSDVGWTLWGSIQAAISDIDFDFWDYAKARWRRAEDVLDSAEIEGALAALGAPRRP